MKDKKKIRIGIVGIAGRMGIAIANSVLENKETVLKAGSEKTNHKLINKDIGLVVGKKEMGINITSKKDEFFKNIDLVIEFGLGSATKDYLLHAKKNKVAFLSGSTGIDKKTKEMFKDAAKSIPIFWSPNMSIGANIIKDISGKITKKISKEFDIDITDLHHKQKKILHQGRQFPLKKQLMLNSRRKR